MRISIIIPTWKAGSTLARAVGSVRKDRFHDKEIILVDNGSKGLARQTVDAVAARVHRLIRLPRNLGYAGGNNRGAREASGEILFLLNDDAWILPGTLGAIEAWFAKDPGVGIIGCKVLNEDGETVQHAGAELSQQAFSRHVGAGEPDGPAYRQPREVAFITGAAWAVRRQLWDQAGGLAEAYYPGYYEETEFCWLARGLGWRILLLPEARVIHRGMQTSGRLSQRYHFNYHRSRLRFVLRTYRRSDLGPFVRTEFRWLLSFRNWDQYPALFLAYILNLLALPHILTGRKGLWKKLSSAGEARYSNARSKTIPGR